MRSNWRRLSRRTWTRGTGTLTLPAENGLIRSLTLLLRITIQASNQMGDTKELLFNHRTAPTFCN
jgi:hypothetical protein